MAANYTRRCDLLRDAGFTNPEDEVNGLADELSALGLVSTNAGQSDELYALREALSLRLDEVPPEQATLAALVPEWLSDHNGDLAGVLWLARATHRERLDVPGFLLGIFKALMDAGRAQDGLTYARFMLDLKFDWGRVYGDPANAYGFMQERDPNPLVWRLLEELEPRAPLRILELGCGIGNDALGFLRSPLVESYVGIDLAEQALTRFRKRAEGQPSRTQPKLIAGDILETLEEAVAKGTGANLVYSYSSLHYFSSSELQRILGLVRALLLGSGPRAGYFAFAIKGAGSLWEGQGLPLYRPDVWVNRDGQSRWFPSPKAVAQLLDNAGFELRFQQAHEHWGYSESGRRDVFHYVLCSPRAEPIGAGI